MNHLSNNITKLKKAREKAEATSQAKSAFIASIAHDLRNPITGIMGIHQGMLSLMETAQSLLHSNASSEQHQQIQAVIQKSQQYINLAQTSTKALLNFLNQILDATQMESGKIEHPPITTFRIRDLLKRNIQLLQPIAHHKQLDLSVEIDPCVPDYLSGRQSYLERILSNLINNALKFTLEGGVRVSASLAQDTPISLCLGDNVSVVICVHDSGMGMPADKLEVIFEPFSRLTPACHGMYSGSGLGLYIVKQYVEIMHGKIEVQSDLIEGTLITLTLPFQIPETTLCSTPPIVDPLLAKSPSKKQPQPSDHTRKTPAKILVVEDNQMAAMALDIALKPLGCAVDIAESGKIALNKAQSQNYDLILMDIGLPDTTGVKVTQKIRSFSDSQKAQVPIVALTGHAGNIEKRQECLEASIQAVLNKPASLNSLKSLLAQYVFEKPSDELKKSNDPVCSDSSTVIDWEGCKALYAHQPEVVDELLSLLADDLVKAREEIAIAYQTQDTETLRNQLHYLLGGLCYLALPQLKQALQAFHQALKANPQDLKQLDNLYAALQQAIDQFLAIFQVNSEGKIKFKTS